VAKFYRDGAGDRWEKDSSGKLRLNHVAGQAGPAKTDNSKPGIDPEIVKHDTGGLTEDD
jgi:hypothetical protein